MARKDRLKEVQEVRGDLRTHIPPLVNRGGQKAAAEALEVSQSTISNWLKDNRYRKVEVWVAADEQVQIVPLEQAS